MSITSGWRLHVDEKRGAGGGHRRRSASRSATPRPSWRGGGCAAGRRGGSCCYSAEDPPQRRGFVLVDAVDGRVVEHFVEDNPEDWAELTSRVTAPWRDGASAN